MRSISPMPTAHRMNADPDADVATGAVHPRAVVEPRVAAVVAAMAIVAGSVTDVADAAAQTEAERD